MLIFFSEFCSCFIIKSLIENFKLVTHYSGKGILYILISIIYLSPSLGNQQSYSAYLFLFVGIVGLFADCKLDKENKNSKFIQPFPPGTKKVPYVRDDLAITSERQDYGADVEIKIETSIKTDTTTNSGVSPEKSQVDNLYVKTASQDKRSANPYDIPDDF